MSTFMLIFASPPIAMSTELSNESQISDPYVLNISQEACQIVVDLLRLHAIYLRTTFATENSKEPRADRVIAPSEPTATGS
jgi:hypothetical protein